MRDILNLYDCRKEGHDWKSRGGCNAGCCDDCACSVPVHECTRCGDCDYGQNEWREQTVAECWAKHGKPIRAMGDDELKSEFERVGAAFDAAMEAAKPLTTTIPA